MTGYVPIVAREKSHTFEVVLDKSHWVIVFASTHCLDSRAETSDRQDNDIANLLGCFHAGKVLPGNVAVAGAHIEVIWVVEVGENSVCPDGWASEFNDTLVVLAKKTSLLALQSFLRDGSYNVNEDRVTGLGLNCPLAKLNATRVPISPIWTIGISLNANHHAVRIGRHIRGDPISSALQRNRVNVRVDTAASKQNKIAEEIGLLYGQGQGIVGFDDLRNGGVKVPDEVNSDVVGNDFVNKGGMLDGPAGLGLAEHVCKLALRRRVFPGLPDVGRRLRVDIVRELVLELLLERAPVQVVEADLRLWLLVGRVGRVEGLVLLLLLLLLLRLQFCLEFCLLQGLGLCLFGGLLLGYLGWAQPG